MQRTNWRLQRFGPLCCHVKKGGTSWVPRHLSGQPTKPFSWSCCWIVVSCWPTSWNFVILLFGAVLIAVGLRGVIRWS